MRLFGRHSNLIMILITFGFIIVVTEFMSSKIIFSGQTETIALTNADKKSKEREHLILDFFERSEDTINAIRDSDAFNQFLAKPDTGDPAFKEMALVIAQSQYNVMKIRYIDSAGEEIIRIDRDMPGKQASVVPESKLQNKSDRYFYYDSKDLPLEQIWFSNIDLNEEQGKVEIPYKPTLRAVFPIAKNNQFNGILIINYFMKPLFDELQNTPLYHTILADNDGEILLHHDQHRQWSRYSGENKLSVDIPEFNKAVLKDTYLGTDFYSRKLALPISQNLILFLSLNDAYFDLQESLSSKRLLYSSGITLLITVIFGVIFAKLLNRFFIEYANRGRDIHELKNLNEQINNLLVQNKIYLQLASDGVHVLDKQGNIVVCSLSFAKMLGYNYEEALKLNVRDWEAQLKENEIDVTLRSFTNEAQKFETKHRCKDGTIIDVEINARLISTSNGDFFYASSRDITERLRLEKELHQLATTDSLTQLPTRRVFMDQLTNELERFHRLKNNSAAVIYLDLDHFKRINDNYGHGVGDKVLILVANILSDEIRKVDTVGRLGGEEFGLILTGTNAEMATHFTNRIRKRIESSPLIYEGKIISFTTSIGITTINAGDSDIEQILDRADKALYKAKDLGRNRVEIYDN